MATMFFGVVNVNEWSVCEDQHGSDHFPILIESVQTHGEDHNPNWKLHKADWDLFNNLCNESH